MAEPAPTQPSRGRWYILFLISVMYLITYLDRVNISTAAPQISKEFGFDNVTMGFIFSAFVWAYALFQVPGGWLSDRFGARTVLGTIVAYWSIMTAATGLAFSATSFIVLRFLFGVGEAGAFPGATRAMQLWYPRQRTRLRARHHPQRQPRWSSDRAADRAADHDQSRLALGISDLRAVGLVWSLWWSLSYRNLPEEHAMVNRAEFETIRGRGPNGEINPPPVAEQTEVPWGTLLRSPNMWAIMLAYFTYVYCLWIFLTWLTKYLIDVRHFTLLKGGLLASLPLWAGVVGDTVGGLATDWLLRRTGNAKLARSAVAITGLLGCAVFIVPAALTEDPYVAVGCLTAAMFFLECTIGPSWAVPMDTGGKYSGTVSGMMNMAGNFGGAISPIVFGYLAVGDKWQAPFIVAAGLLVVGAAIWAFWIDPNKAILKSE